MTMRYRVTCDDCGGTDILRDSYTYWNEETQDWETHSIYDDFICLHCGEVEISYETIQ